MIENVTRLTVRYNDRVVGFLERLRDGRIAFQYSETWVKEGFSLSPFSLPLSDQVYVSSSEYFEGLHGVFYDSLPDGWGEYLTRKTLMEQGISYDKVNVLTKLSLVNHHGLGGLEYVPSQSKEEKKATLKLDDLAAHVEAALNNDIVKTDLDALYLVGGASGGARPKVYIADEKDAWIVKFPALLDPKNMGQCEFDANACAKRCGIHVNEFKLFPSKKSPGYFGAKRFDRVGETRMHVISLAALLETTHRIPTLDYTHFFQVIQRICVDQDDLYEAFKRMSFNVLYGNKDDHGKNMAFYYDEARKGYRLSPFYDITKTPDKLEHEMTVLGQGRPTEADLLKLAKQFNLSLSHCQNIIRKIDSIIT